MPAYGQEPVFDHLQSGFPLIGAHRRIPCESCHAGGAFEGTPTDCRTCHGNTGSLALTGKPANHIQTSSPCEDCHSTIAWSPARFDHTGVTAACSTCHNGTTATGKSPTHLPTANTCDDCHTTAAWTPARFDHSGVTAVCATCHNGSTATCKSPTHLPTTNTCDDCHTTAAWTPARFDHTGVTAACSSCHNGTTATGKSPTHLATSNTCDGHTTAADPARFDHTGVTAACSTCHNGTQATGKPGSHLPTASACDDCHMTAAWSPARFDHSGVTASCGTCHNGSTATGKPNNHFISSLDCGECHNTSVWSRRRSTRPTTRAAIDRSRLRGVSRREHRGLGLAHAVVQARLRRLPRDRLQAESAQEGRLTAAALLGQRAARLHRRLSRLHRRDAHADPGTPQWRAQCGEGRLVRATQLRCALLALCCLAPAASAEVGPRRVLESIEIVETETGAELWIRFGTLRYLRHAARGRNQIQIT
jgi:hypothetical protein